MALSEPGEFAGAASASFGGSRNVHHAGLGRWAGAVLRPGNSGSPVYRPGGGVIGVVDKSDFLRPTYSIAVTIHYVIELAKRYGAPWHGVD